MLKWTGPYRVSDLLAACIDADHPWPPDNSGVYLVTKKRWTNRPSAAAHPLYFGGNSGRSPRFCTRVGDLIADAHGFYGASSGHHSGGQSIYTWCCDNGVEPGSLFIGWATGPRWCDRCAEIELAQTFLSSWSEREAVGLLNKRRPPACKLHGTAMP